MRYRAAGEESGVGLESVAGAGSAASPDSDETAAGAAGDERSESGGSGQDSGSDRGAGGAGERGSREVAVIVPAYRAAGTIGSCVAALRAQTAPPAEIVVVDDGSPDDTRGAAEAAGARVIRQANQGPAAARNTGLQQSRAPLVVCTDADCTPAPDFLERMTAPFEDPTVAGTKGTYTTRQPEVVARLVQLEYESRYRVTARAQAAAGSIDFVDTYAAGFRRAALEEVGAFDPTLRICEDQDLSFRLAAQGHRLVFCPDAVVEHLHERTWWGYAKKKARIAWWKVRVLRRYPKRAVRDSHTPQALKLQVVAAGAFCVATVGALAALALGRGPAALVAPAVALVALLALGSGFFRHVARREPRLLLWVSAFLLVRAVALGVGLAAGIAVARLSPTGQKWTGPRA